MTDEEYEGRTGHKRVTCSCQEGPCMFCGGGLFACVRCNGLEGSVPTECPREPMTHEQADAVYAGTLDFRAGAWHEGEATRNSPTGVRLWHEEVRSGAAPPPVNGQTMTDLGQCPPENGLFHAVPCLCLR